MEISNRFDLLSSLVIDEEPIESSFINITISEKKQEINDEQPTKNFWEVPEYVEKRIPHSTVLITKKKYPR